MFNFTIKQNVKENMKSELAGFLLLIKEKSDIIYLSFFFEIVHITTILSDKVEWRECRKGRWWLNQWTSSLCHRMHVILLTWRVYSGYRRGRDTRACQKQLFPSARSNPRACYAKVEACYTRCCILAHLILTLPMRFGPISVMSSLLASDAGRLCKSFVSICVSSPCLGEINSTYKRWEYFYSFI